MPERTNIRLSAADRSELETVAANRNSPQKHVWRAKIVLLTADGHGTADIMRATGKAKTVIWRWQERFGEEGVTGLWRDKTRPARIPPLRPEVAERVVALTLAGPPPTASHWTGAAMAKAAGISVSSVQRIWRAHGLRPHLVRRFKLSNDPQFAAKLKEIVGLYINPPNHAIVLSVDEKSQIVLLTADGHGTADIMRATGKAKTVIWRWQERFGEEGVTGLWRDKTRPARIPPLRPEVAERVVALTLAGPPPTASHWTGAAMAKAAGISVSSVQRIWRAHGLRPHLVRRFKLSNDPQFAAKLKEIVGLYINPPNHAIVLSVDEKSQIQALDRTQPGLPMKKGRAGTITHD